MAYDPTIWVDDVTPISATNMNKIEQGIFDALPRNEVSVPVMSASGSFVDTTTMISMGNMYTKTIPLGITGKSGSLFITGRASVCGALISFDTNPGTAGGVGSTSNTSSTLRIKTFPNLASVYDSASYEAGILRDCYISGTNLKLIFENIGTADRAICVTECLWEVQA